MAPRVFERVLLPYPQVRNPRHIQRKLGIGVSGKEDEMGTTKHPANRLEHPQKKWTFRGKNLVETTELGRQNNVLSRNTPGRQGNRTMVGPENYHTLAAMRHWTQNTVLS